MTEFPSTITDVVIDDDGISVNGDGRVVNDDGISVNGDGCVVNDDGFAVTLAAAVTAVTALRNLSR